MTRSFSAVAAAFLSAIALTPLSVAHGQQVIVMGEARGNDHLTPPPRWSVLVTAWVNGIPGQEIYSNGVNYTYPLHPPGPVKLVYSSAGYQQHGEDVSLTGGNPLRKDVVLKRIVPYRTGSLEERRTKLREELNEQAEIARIGGAAAQDVYRWNLHLYERLYRSTELSRDVREFSSRSDITMMQRTDGFLERQSMYERLLPESTNAGSSFSSSEITQSLRKRLLGTTIRCRLAWMLIDASPVGEERQEALETLRSLATEGDPQLTTSAFGGLLRLGDSNDVAQVVQAMHSTSATLAFSAVNAIRITRFGEGANPLIALVQSALEPQLRAVAAHALAAVAPERATPVLLRTLSLTEQPEVLLSTLEALQTYRVFTSADQVALRRLLSHPNGEIRTEAARALQAAGQGP